MILESTHLGHYNASTVRVRNDSRALQFGLRLVDKLELAGGYVSVGEHNYFFINFFKFSTDICFLKIVLCNIA